MYGLSIDLIEKLSDRFQVGKSSPSQRVTVRRGDKSGGYEVFPFELPDVTSISVSRRWDMAADELEVTQSNVNGYYSNDYSPLKEYTNVGSLPLSGYKGVMMAYNRVTCDLGYGNSLRRMFTGGIQSIDISENPPTLKFNARNEYRKLLRPIDPIDTRELIYEGKTAFDIIDDLRKRAGIDAFVYDNHTVDDKDYGIDKIILELGMNYADAISDIITNMNHRIVCGRYGELRVVLNENYSQQDFHNWEFDDFVDLTDGNYTVDSGVLRNRVIVMSSGSWQAFEDPFLKDYCNGELLVSGIESKWAETLEQKWAVADHFFRNMRRKLRRISVAVPGNPSMDVGDLVKMRMLTSTATGKYIIIGINSNYSSGGYIDQVELEYAVAGTGHLCEPAAGDYVKPPDPLPEIPDIPDLEIPDLEIPDPPDTEPVALTPVGVSLRDKIVNYAKTFLGIYYQWGGNYPQSGYGVDCSHFTYQVLKKFKLMDGYRRARDQKTWCRAITKSELKPGDLLFYTWGAGVVQHVTMYLGNGKAIGANGGDGSTTSKGVAQRQNAKVKIQSMGSPNYYGRPPGLVGK